MEYGLNKSNVVSYSAVEMNGEKTARPAPSAPDPTSPGDPYVTVGTNYLTTPAPAYDELGSPRQRSSVHIERPIYNQSEFDAGFDARQRHVKSFKERAVALTKKCACTPSCVKNQVLGFLPFIRIMKKYNVRTDLFGDIVAGITVGIMQIPQGKMFCLYYEKNDQLQSCIFVRM